MIRSVSLINFKHHHIRVEIMFGSHTPIYCLLYNSGVKLGTKYINNAVPIVKYSINHDGFHKLLLK